MNKVETIIYNAVRQHPFIKKAVKSLYQGAFDLLPRKKELIDKISSFKIGYFFGFHDVSQLSEDETKLLACKVPFDGRMPNDDESLEIGYFDFINGEIGDFHKISKTLAWNWHKGCRLQWIDNSRVIFNKAENGMLVSCIIDTSTNQSKTINYPIDAICKTESGLIATSFCYERLNLCMPGYGYPVTDGDVDDDYPDGTGLFLVDLEQNTRKCIVSLKQLADQIGFSYLNGYRHFVTHTEFSKDGKYISFLYRAVPKGEEGKDMHKTWIVIYNMITGKFFPLPTQQSGSHYVWNKKNQIIASCIIDGKNCHVFYDINDIDHYRIIAGSILNSDGHQSFVNDEVFITDTYPDKWRMANLYMVNVTNQDVELLARVYSPKRYQTKDVHCHIACDLHPRVSPSGKYVCFDSPRTGQRGIYVMKLKSI